ncbi:MAG: DUF4238 domain-containing protein [Verrucomicrobiales bacterium]|jgi:hypothetical protein|nr:DUF4238 domain-containing protein [Verrucomicrobiales bacterium]
MSIEYRNHHYVPKWYQKKFMLPGTHDFFYLSLKPEIFSDPRGITHSKKVMKKLGSNMCFAQEDLYTTTISGIETTDIEKYFFGEIDSKGSSATKQLENFSHPPTISGTSLTDFLRYMSTQKLRTPKGLAFLSDQIGSTDKNRILQAMVNLRELHCAIWTECVWLIADASLSDTKFIISDHPVTIYNRECGPRSQWCRGSNDPEIWLQGSHTIFPLSINKILILTNLSWVRNPYQSALKERPNSQPFRHTIFRLLDIQILRHLKEEEVRQINFVIKSRAYRYIAAGKEEWLYPEKYVSKSDWNTFGHGYLFMPDPRPIHTGGELLWGYTDGRSGAMDEYGRLPFDPNFSIESKNHSDQTTLQWFQGEFAQLFGSFRRGRSYSLSQIDKEQDDTESHQYHLSLRKKSFKERRNTK